MNASDESVAPCPGNATQGCYGVLRQELHDKVIIVAASGIGVAVVQLLALALTLCLCCRIPSADEQRQSLLSQAYLVNRTYDSGVPPTRTAKGYEYVHEPPARNIYA
jgi:hypothetical protein